VLKVAYITNRFPAAVEWYVIDEINELRKRGVEVVTCSAKKVNGTSLPPDLQKFARETISLTPLRPSVLWRALRMFAGQSRLIREFIGKEVIRSNDSWGKRIKALAHTLLGVCLATTLRDRKIEHIHVHHGYFAAWVAMVAARLLGITYSMTLHGSDLLLHASHMETKLSECKFCMTVSEFNRRHILAHYPAVDPKKILLQRMGVEVPIARNKKQSVATPLLLSVGRLHSVKDHAFLLRACYFLRECGMPFRCVIVGDGPERRKLHFLAKELGIADIVSFTGHIPHHEITRYYDDADLVVLTSRSEGIPLVLMEAMARERIVLAPAITGISELVIDGRTGFLYKRGSLEDFVWRAGQICASLHTLDFVRRNAREHVREHFNQETNLQQFAERFLGQIAPDLGSYVDENPVLQQI
jgi:colanic acid/amylovoran biosynthesis glycosyltransferase